MKRMLCGLVAAGLALALTAPAVAQDYSGSIAGSLAFRGEVDPFNVAVVSINASGDPTDADGTYQYRVTYRDDSGAILTYKEQGRVTCFARIGDRAYVEFRYTKVMGGGPGGPAVGDYLIEAWEDGSATGRTDRHTLGGIGFPGPGHCTDELAITELDRLLDGFPPDFIRHGNVTIR